jgi:hypothetical protein
MIIENRELRSIKRIDERYELRQLPAYNMQFLEYNPTGNNVEGICTFICNTTQSK